MFLRWNAPSWLYVVPLTPGTASTGQPDTTDVGYGWANLDEPGGDPNQAQADGYKVGGPNAGTRVNAFGEDLTSSFGNRAIKFLFENTDQLDEWLNTDHPQLFLHTVTVSGGPTSTITLPAKIYLGSGVLNATTLPKLFRLLDANGDEVTGDSLEPVLAQACSLGTAPVSGYSGGSFTITLSEPIAVGTYYLLCSRHRSLAFMDRDALLPPVLASGARASGAVTSMLRKLRGDGEIWTNPWLIDIQTLAWRGLDGIYRNALTRATTPARLQSYYWDEATDQPAAGGYYSRDGASMLGFSALNLVSDSNYQDPFCALWSAWCEDVGPGDGEDVGEFIAGTRGLVYVGQRQLAKNPATFTYPPSLGGFASYVAHRDTHSGYTAVPTYIDPAGASCNVQRVSSVDRLTVTAAGNYFRKTISGTPRSSVVLGQTLVEVEWTNPSDPISPGNVERRVYRVMDILSDTMVRVRNQDGSQVGFPASSTAGTILRWFTPVFVVPDGLGEMQDLRNHPDEALFETGSLWCVSPPIHTQTAPDQVPAGQGAYLGASDDTSSNWALRWGGYSRTTFQYRVLAKLTGDGSIVCVNITTSGSVTCDRLSVVGNIQCADIDCDDISSDEITCNVITCDVGNFGILTASEITADNANLNRLHLNTSALTDSANGNHTLNLTTVLGSGVHAVVTITGSGSVITGITLPSMTSGRRFAISFVHTTAGNTNLDSWPVAVKFADPADALLSGYAGAVDTYEGVKLPNGNIQMTVVRTLWSSSRPGTSATSTRATAGLLGSARQAPLPNRRHVSTVRCSFSGRYPSL